jgi:ribonuclease-3
MITKQIIESILKFEIKDEGIYQNAFIHKSALKNMENVESNERLEFLGDSVLSVIVAEILYKEYPKEQEGFLTKQRTKLVNGKTLSKIAKDLQFNRFIVMDERGMSKEWNTNVKMLENTFEAFIGAIYISEGFKKAKEWVEMIMRKEIKEEDFLHDDNYKEQVLKTFQNVKLIVSNEIGKENEKTFVIQLSISGKYIAEGYGKSKKEAEQDACKKCLVCFGKVKLFNKNKV